MLKCTIQLPQSVTTIQSKYGFRVYGTCAFCVWARVRARLRYKNVLLRCFTFCYFIEIHDKRITDEVVFNFIVVVSLCLLLLRFSVLFLFICVVFHVFVICFSHFDCGCGSLSVYVCASAFTFACVGIQYLSAGAISSS